MQTYLVSFVAAAVLSALLTPVARLVAFKFGIVAVPGGRHIHGRKIPRLGGLGIFSAFVVAMTGLALTGYLAGFDERAWRMGTGLMAGGSIMFAIGMLDDVKGVRALYKLGVQVLAALVAWGFGFRIDVIDLPFMEGMSIGILSLPVTVVWIVGIINAVNLIDGLDGLAAGVVFFAGITNFVVAYLMGTTFVAVVMATLAGSVLGFLFYNFNPARIFMGDSGSYFLGYVLAVCSIAGPLQKASAAVSIAVPIVALGVPIIDTLLAMVRRFLERRPIFSPDRGHIHHRLLDMGITHRRAVLIIYGVTIALCIGAIGIAFGRQWEVGGAILGVSAVLFGLTRFVGTFESLAIAARQKQRIRSRHVEWLRKCIMYMPREVDEAKTEEAVLDTLKWVAMHARLDFVELHRKQGNEDPVIKRWTGADYTDMDERDVTIASFPFCAEGQGWRLRFGWRSEYSDVSPQMDILLQLVADQVEGGLRRVGSVMVAVPEPVPTPEPSTQPQAAIKTSPAHGS